MQQTNLSSLPREFLKRLEVIPSLPELPSGIKLSLDWMEVADHVEDVLKNENNFMVLISFHLLKLNVMRIYNHY